MQSLTLTRFAPIVAGRHGGLRRAAWLSGRDLRIVLLVAVWVPLVLGMDTMASPAGQRLLGLGTWLLLLAVLAGESRATRMQVAVVVGFATLVEYVFAGALGVYVYRLHNVPAFVPPGHGLVYLAALCLGRSAWAARHGRAFLRAALACCGGWALWGLVVSPRLDVLGAFWFGCLLVFARRGRSPLLYAGAVVVVSYLELIGTGLGTWTWQLTDPTGLVAIGNPPSGIAGGYAWFDAAALALTPRLLRLRLPAVSRPAVSRPAVSRPEVRRTSAAAGELAVDGGELVPQPGGPFEVELGGSPRHADRERLVLPVQLRDGALGELHR